MKALDVTLDADDRSARRRLPAAQARFATRHDVTAALDFWSTGFSVFATVGR
jgi:hypothetical protein